MKSEPQLELALQDFDELAAGVKPAESQWDRMYRVLSNMFTTLQDIQKTQLTQIKVAEQTAARLTILEGKIK